MNANRKTILFPCGTLTEKKDFASTVCLIIISRVPDPNPVTNTSTDRGPIYTECSYFIYVDSSDNNGNKDSPCGLMLVDGVPHVHVNISCQVQATH
jgi:hypothetical protein